MIEKADALLRREGVVRQGDNLVVLASAPLIRQGTTNLMWLHRAGDPLTS